MQHRSTRADRAERKHHVPSVQVGDIEQALSDRTELHCQAPRVPKAKEMVEQVKIVGKDALTAADQAIYEALLAWARENGLDKDGHRIPVATIKSYAEVTRTDDLVAMLHRLSTTYVKYDIRDAAWRRRGTLPLILAEVAENFETQESEVRFSVPAAVRELMLTSSSYAMLELAAFPRFSSRYSARLYQRLALRAGYTRGTRGPWEIEPRKLAESLGYTFSGTFRYPDFRRHALEPALRDISCYVQRFRVVCSPVLESKGRGRPAVARLRFDFEDNVDFVPPMASLKASVSTALVSDEIRILSEKELARTDGKAVPADLIPDASMLSRLRTLLRDRGYEDLTTKSFVLWDSWLAVLDEAFAFEGSGEFRPDAPAPRGDIDLCGAYLLDELKEQGLEATLVAWALACEETGRYMHRIVPAPVIDPNESREEKSTRLMKEAALHQIERLPPTTRHSYDQHVECLCDPDVMPWSSLVREHKVGRALAAALRAIGKWSSSQRQRQSILNLLGAVAEYDVDKIALISRAVLASDKSSRKADTERAPS